MPRWQRRFSIQAGSVEAFVAFFAPGFVRLSYATGEANIVKGLDRMARALGELR